MNPKDSIKNNLDSQNDVSARSTGKQNVLVKKPKKTEKKKTNLEGFIEELDRNQYLKEKKEEIVTKITKQYQNAPSVQQDPQIEQYNTNSVNINMQAYDENTNLYIGNISKETTEEELCKLFSQFGPLSSVKIMEQDQRFVKTYAFVSFVYKVDSERALAKLNGFYFNKNDLILKPGKPIKTHSQIYAYEGKEMLRHTTPNSGLPFNCYYVKNTKTFSNVKPFVYEDLDCHSDAEVYSDKSDAESYSSHASASSSCSDTEHEDSKLVDNNTEQNISLEDKISSSLIKVVIPCNKRRLFLINRAVEFVIMGGPIFEAILMNRERANPEYAFLWDHTSYEHVYYRWKMFSLLNGDAFSDWRSDPFIMYKNGSIFYPPVTRSLLERKSKELDVRKCASISKKDEHSLENKMYHITDDEISILSKKNLKNFLKLLKNLNCLRQSVYLLMTWCIYNADCSYQIVHLLKENIETSNSVDHVLATLYLINDILMNCSVKMPNAFKYRKMFSVFLPSISNTLYHITTQSPNTELASVFRAKCAMCFTKLKNESIFTGPFIQLLLAILNGQKVFESDESIPEMIASCSKHILESRHKIKESPIVLKNEATINKNIYSDEDDDDLDGVPIKNDICENPKNNSVLSSHFGNYQSDEDSDDDIKPPKSDPHFNSSNFKTSNWQTVSAEVSEPSMFSIWDKAEHSENSDDDLDGEPIENNVTAVVEWNDETYEKKRKIEIAVANYQMALRQGIKSLPKGKTEDEAFYELRKALSKKYGLS